MFNVCAAGEYFEECSYWLPEYDGDGGDEGPGHQTDQASRKSQRLPTGLSDGDQADLQPPPQGRHLIPVGECEELSEVEDDGEEEEDEGVGQPGLGAEAELEAVDG